MEPPLLDGMLAALPCMIVLYAVIKRDKTIAALVQMGGLQDREAAADALATALAHDQTDSGSESEHGGRIPEDDGPRSQIKEIKTEQKMLLADKITFTVSVINTMITPYVLGAAPAQFYILYSPKAILLTIQRYRDFVKTKKQWLLMDFCYWANGLVLFYIWCRPTDPVLFQVVFMVSNGPLAWSMLAFSHSMIFHSYPHITSVFIHASPMLLTFGLRWHGQAGDDGFVVCSAEDAGVPTLADYVPGSVCDVPTMTLLWQALANFYIPWIVGYYFFIFVVLGKYIKQRGFQTLYDRVTEKGPLKPLLSALTKMHVHGLIKRLVYLVCHLGFGVLTMLMASIYWRTFWGHLAFIAIIVSSTAWNGATHYFNAVIKPKDARAQHQQLMKVAQRSQKLSVSEVSPTAPADRKAK